MTNQLTLSICQFPIAFLNRTENEKKALFYIKEAASEQADLIIFPEMTLTGISKNVSEMADSDYNSIAFFKKAAIHSQIAIGFGWGNPTGDKLENHYTIIGKDGTILSDYIKIHPFTYGGEDRCFVRGSSFQTFSYKNFTIASFICYDMRFPEIFQAASKDADLILLAANWPKARSMHWKVLSQARAIENQVYFAACNCVGNVGGLLYSGDSTLYTPEGDIIKSLSETEGLITCTITNNVSSVRKGFPVKQDRLIDYYKDIL